jgi:hypothetical protein
MPPPAQVGKGPVAPVDGPPALDLVALLTELLCQIGL